MIQRIQTVYLALAAIMGFVMLGLPFVKFLADEQEFRLLAFGLESVNDPEDLIVRTWALGLVVALSLIITLVNIFLFKFRLLQIRLSFVNMVLYGGMMVLLIFYIYNGYKSMEVFTNHSMKLYLTSILPLFSLIVTYMAMRAIVKDESLVRSLDRIR